MKEEHNVTDNQPPETVSSVRRMYQNYDRTGHFAALDLRRVLGDPTKGVEISPSCEYLMASKSHQG
ncbi:hypothetical protein [Bradyrhizobium cosmicum]|uniref:hypothetical protein n=1 Tax=Bradyrhizobium cosmicum TaxID=1404864 RepID=UPI001162363F|nr:hypothetical protein [Bradyrhizobium cosmicum]QDP26253.1 hypothetical protein FNV92_30655 [Bradyrhizobium cosmicum]